MEFYKVASIEDIGDGKSKAFQIGEHDVVVFHYRGNYYGLRRWCTHMGGDLSQGVIKDKVVTCPRHGSQFDITTGQNLCGPTIGPIHLSHIADETTYPVKVEGNGILVGVADKNMMP